MDYEKKYKEALNLAKSYYENHESGANQFLDTIFPELRESEDERIRNNLIRFFKREYGTNSNAYFAGIKVKDVIAWLEKQGEQKSNNNTKPKFKVGDWITDGDYTWKIVEVKPLDYILQSQDGNIVDDTISHVDSNFNFWGINDAKDGDVLATEYFIFIFKNIDNGNGVHYYCHYEISKHEDDEQFGIALQQSLMGRIDNNFSRYSPATNEQRSILLQKMHDAGCEWDANTKQLIKNK